MLLLYYTEVLVYAQKIKLAYLTKRNKTFGYRSCRAQRVRNKM